VIGDQQVRRAAAHEHDLRQERTESDRRQPQELKVMMRSQALPPVSF
jgi:hypothetical protein